MIHGNQPTREEQLLILSDPELQDERQAWRRDAIPVPRGPLRGRRRQTIEEEKTLSLSMPATEVDAPKLRNLQAALSGKQPLFDKFTLHRHVQPTHGSIEAYLHGGSNRTINGKRVGPKPITDYPPAERQNVLRARQRQYQYLSNSLQRDAFDDRNIARTRRYSLMATQNLLDSGQPLDPDAARWSADAVIDFGHNLNDETNRPILNSVHDADLGFQIIRIGALADSDSELLVANRLLLRMVQREQHARED